MITASSGKSSMASVPGLKEMVYENRASYARRWGHEFLWANTTSYNFGVKVYWNKIPILQDALSRFPNAKWVWWLDLDILLMTLSIDIVSHLLSDDAMQRQIEIDQPIKVPGGGLLGLNTPKTTEPKSQNFIISQDKWGLNVGSFLMRAGNWTDFALDMWKDPLAIEKDWTYPEQEGFAHMYKHHPIIRDHTLIVNQRALNAYPDWNTLGEQWQEGDLLVHFAGCKSNPACPERWDKLWKIKESYEVPELIKKELADGTAKIETMQKGKPLV